ncbi:hypothetical protein [Cryobacterium sp. W22_MBD10_FK3]|uniref:hypothetical protein n=1 Tax=Cryobacterium sp. W22_MBD10_FK3 TaxID=3240273 RepID=UPI003F93F213
MKAKRALMIGILMAALSLAGCATGPSDEDLKSEAECLEAIGLSDVHIVDGRVLYTIDPLDADLPTFKAAIAACKPGATPDSVYKAVTG